MLSFKLALSNLRKGFKSFAPFLLACITMFVMIFVTASISSSPSIEKLHGAAAVAQLMSFAMVVVGIFSALILIYSYRFLQLQRSREFGLYDILGFGKGRVALVAFFELVLSYLITTIVGVLCGIAFSKFLFLIFVNMIGGNYFNLEISGQAILTVAAIFLVYFIILMFVGTWIIYRSSSLDLLKEASKGEKEPKANAVFALLGVILLGAGYFMAVRVDNPVSALTTFFVAVIAVIIGTYLFYMAFTVWYLKWKKRRPSYYKKPQNFITTSSMLYRMKANAAGLGNITILLSMALVTMVVTLGIFFGSVQVVQHQFPENTTVSQDFTSQALSRQELKNVVEAAAEKQQVKISDLHVIQLMSNNMVVTKQEKGSTLQLDDSKFGSLSKNALAINLTTLSDIKEMDPSVSSALTENQVLLIDEAGDTSSAKTIDWYGKTYQVAGHLSMPKNWPRDPVPTDTSIIVFASDAGLQSALNAYNKSDEYKIVMAPMAYLNVSSDDYKKLAQGITSSNLRLANRADSIKDTKASIGGFVFIGFILGISFILGAALIIYYKQLSEGMQDKRSFKILQEVGLSKVEVQKTIKSQVRIIFFLPIVVTIVHFGFAYIMISKIIEIFGITDQFFILGVSVAVIAIVALLYYVIYKATSLVYYKIVER